MNSRTTTDTIGVLASGGLDSSILIGQLLRQGRRVQPFYIRTGLVWQAGELPALERFLRAIQSDQLAELVALNLPLDDLYRGHWSLTGDNTPGAESPDEAVFLPGRNALLIVKAAVWCQLHGIGEFRHLVGGQYPGIEILPPRSRLLAHQGIGVGNADLRAVEVRIDPQRQAIMLQRFIVAPRHAQDFGIRILRVWLTGQQLDIMLHDT